MRARLRPPAEGSAAGGDPPGGEPPPPGEGSSGEVPSSEPPPEELVPEYPRASEAEEPSESQAGEE